MREPERTADLLAYYSIIIKASMDYDDMPWLRAAKVQAQSRVRLIIVGVVIGVTIGTDS